MTPETIVEEKVAEETVVEETPEEQPQPSTPSTPAEAPQDERKASVQIPLSVHWTSRARLSKSYLDAATEALRRGIPVKEAVGMIDGLNAVISTIHFHSFKWRTLLKRRR